MDTLSKLEIETAIAQRLPNCRVACVINADSSASLDILAPGTNQFTIANIDRSRYHGASGINRLVREILEEMVVTRQLSRFSSSGRNDVTAPVNTALTKLHYLQDTLFGVNVLSCECPLEIIDTNAYEPGLQILITQPWPEQLLHAQSLSFEQAGNTCRGRVCHGRRLANGGLLLELEPQP
ncbi:hypothetical protein [Pseudomonas sp. MPFS]|uniref:hypothetical protein n=1 Tax=Pseudomonas sp. MPFS TaxID=2795724 RepID=UPI001F13298F|nr:hypothetical protein [Pseudomonas sp. MPFS]